LQIRPLDPAAPPAANADGGAVVARDQAAGAAPVQGATNEPSAEAVKAAAAAANAALAQRNAALEFSVDADTHRVVVRLVDTQDRTVLRQVPSEEMLAIARAIEHMELKLLRNSA
jgi:flagellar protein FlaG